MGMRGLAARLARTPRQVARGVAPHHLAVVPVHVQHVGGRPGGVGDGVGAQVADALMDVEPSVRTDHNQAVHPPAAADEGADADADADGLGAAAGRAQLRPFLPAEHLRAKIQRLAREATRHRALGGAEPAVVSGGVHPPDVEPVDPQLACGLVDDGLEHGHDLGAARSPLCRARRGVGVHRYRAEAHVLGLVAERRHRAGGVEVAGAAVGAGVLNDVEVDGGDPAVVPEAHLREGLEPGARPADVRLLVAVDPQHHRTPGLPRHDRGHVVDGRPGDLAAEPAPAVLRHKHDIGLVHAETVGQPRVGARRALGGGVQIELAVLPVRHDAARLHRMMGQRLVQQRLLEHQIRVHEAVLDFTDVPFHLRLAHRQPVGARGVEVLVGPLELADLAGLALAPLDVAVQAGVGAARAQAVERVHHEGQGLEVDPDRLDGVRRRGFVHRGHRQHGLALVERLVGQGGLCRDPRDLGHQRVVGGQDVDHPLHRQRRARVDAAHAAVGHGGEQQLGEEHALRAEVLGVPGPAGDLGSQIRGRDVSSNSLLGHFILLRKRPFVRRVGPSTRRLAPPNRGSCCSRRNGRGCRRAPAHIERGWRPGCLRRMPPCS